MTLGTSRKPSDRLVPLSQGFSSKFESSEALSRESLLKHPPAFVRTYNGCLGDQDPHSGEELTMGPSGVHGLEHLPRALMARSGPRFKTRLC